jgi:hypothetical protein
MPYLQPSQYVAYGLDPTTPAAAVAAAPASTSLNMKNASGSIPIATPSASPTCR